MLPTFPRRILVLTVACLAAASIGCWDDETVTGPVDQTVQAPESGEQDPSEGGTSANSSSGWVVPCEVDVIAGSMTCGEEDGDAPPDGISALIVGAQDTFVSLTNEPPSFDTGTRIFSAVVRVKNLLPQPLGTTDGTTLHADGIRVFFHTGPTNGVTVNNHDGTTSFTNSNQPFFQYDRIAGEGEETVGKTWEWNVPTGVSSFTFSVYVDAEVPHPNGWVEVTPPNEGLALDETVALSAQAYNIVGDPVSRSFAWSSSDGATVSVDGLGNVTGKANGGPVTVTATPTDGAEDPGTANVSVGGNDIAVSLTVTPDAVKQGSSLDHVLTVKNNGPTSVNNVYVRMEVLGTIEPVFGCGWVERTATRILYQCFFNGGGDGLSDGEEQSIRTRVAPQAVETLSANPYLYAIDNSTNLSSDPNSANDSTVKTTIVEDVPDADLELVLNRITPDSVFVDQQMVHTITVTNAGPDDMDGTVVVRLIVKDALHSAEVGFPSGCGQLSGTGYQCSLGPIAAGQSATTAELPVEALAAGVGDSLEAEAFIVLVDDDSFDPDGSRPDTTYTDIVDAPDLVPSSLTFTPTSPFDDQTVTVDATITNNSTVGTGSGFGWELFVDGNPSPVQSGSESALAAGASVPIQVTGLGPYAAGAHGAQDHAVELVVDVADAVVEKNESNNAATDSLGVQAYGYQITLEFADPGFTQEQRDSIRAAADRWEAIINDEFQPLLDGGSCTIAGVPNAVQTSETVDDLLIFILLRDLGSSALGIAKPCTVRDANEITVVGNVILNTQFIAEMTSSGQITDVVGHEMGHVLGIGTTWNADPGVTGDVDLIQGEGTGDPYFSGAEAINQFNNAGGSGYTGNKVPVRVDPPDHWRENPMDVELMTTGSEAPGAERWSLITGGALQDMGYGVNLTVPPFDPYALNLSSSLRLKPESDSELLPFEEILGRPDTRLLPDGRVVPIERED